MDESIISELSELEQCYTMYLQPIPSHVGVHGNKMADDLARKGCNLSATNSVDMPFKH